MKRRRRPKKKKQSGEHPQEAHPKTCAPGKTAAVRRLFTWKHAHCPKPARSSIVRCGEARQSERCDSRNASRRIAFVLREVTVNIGAGLMGSNQRRTDAIVKQLNATTRYFASPKPA